MAGYLRTGNIPIQAQNHRHKGEIMFNRDTINNKSVLTWSNTITHIICIAICNKDEGCNMNAVSDTDLYMAPNPFKPKKNTIVIFIHYKSRIATAIRGL